MVIGTQKKPCIIIYRGFVVRKFDRVLGIPFRPPLRKDMMEGDFFIGAALATTLTKVALKYIHLTTDKKRQNVSAPHLYLRY